eukprot:CAMPEP_0197178638 /NCGR_PEP_ID=MMETSP1423-20130617/3858_1 /TAXON_ID=476441 /ORGANISM="Pseudo-nitzschia heimii, Strain UNC1101" /LENGTH=368 /DNA_ID=CAMNT_0042628421 /DNA_START=104 /DNA_END=1210 /DNA_ORIENTATION=+
MSRKEKKPSGKIALAMISFLVVATMFTYLALIMKIHDRHGNGNQWIIGELPFSTGNLQEMEDRIQYLETKLDSYLAYGKDPFLSMKEPAKCKDKKTIKEIACPENKRCEVDNSAICLDDLPYDRDGNDKKTKGKKKKDKCVVYDYGIRESPEFGLAFAKQCDVVGFDPSPISAKWWKKKKGSILKEHPGYSFSNVGAGGVDGDLELREYDWDQVSIIQFPQRVINTNDCNKEGKCKYHMHDRQKSFFVPVQTLKTSMTEHKHSRVHLLKLDVEGSEYSFLETMIDDLSCRKVDQLVMEWHHYDHDIRYGMTSNPQINVLVALLKERCGLEQFWVHGSKGWPSNDKVYAEMGMTLYYNLASFKRTRWNF